MLTPDFYWTALNLQPGASREDVTKAYRSMASNGEHPDNGADPERWKLITAAFNELKSIFNKKRSKYTTPGDEAWLRAWEAMNMPENNEPETEQTTDETEKFVFVFTERDGESKEDRKKRRAREYSAAYCNWRYKHDPEYAAKRKASSLKSHKAANAKKKAAKEAAAAAAA